METSADVMCPSCGEIIELWLDLSVDSQTYIEDCSVCCRPMQVTFKDDAAWVIALTEYSGTFEGGPVDFISAQLVVLTRDSGTWRIRSIHWSSRPNIPG